MRNKGKFANFNTFFVKMTLFIKSLCKNLLENDVITTDMNLSGIHLLNYLSVRLIQPFSFEDKSTWSILPFVALALCHTRFS